jgi:predicted carbohydrate-binding protein with CBM5 and CBM33 domain
MGAVTVKKTLAVVGAALLMVLVPTVAGAHGYTVTPTSRAVWCQQGQVTGCGPVQWEPQSVEGPKGFPQQGPADGAICSAGIDRFAQLDDPGLNWPLSEVDAGGVVQAHWHLTASHRTTSWEYFVTRDGWDPSQPLTRAALERKPFATVYSDGVEYPPRDTVHDITLPDGKSGRHLILGVWTIADTPNAFYQCADVDFG